MRIFDKKTGWVNTNNKLITNLIELKDLNAKSEKRIQEVLDKMDLDGLTEKLLQDTDKILAGIK